MSRTSVTNRATDTAPTFVVPAGGAVGDVYSVSLTMNNSDVITAEPSGLVQREAFASGAAISTRLYTMVLDGTTTTAGQTKTWTLSAARQWNILVIGDSGISTASPYVDSDFLYVVGTTTTLPSYVTSETSLLYAHVFAKSDGTTITAFAAAPAGWTKVADSASNTTFGFAGSLGAANSAAAAGTVGGETWGAPNQTAGSTLRYLVAMRPVSTGTTWTYGWDVVVGTGP